MRQTEPAKLTKLVRGELDWIVMKALEKDRDRRYETANGFARGRAALPGRRAGAGVPAVGGVSACGSSRGGTSAALAVAVGAGLGGPRSAAGASAGRSATGNDGQEAERDRAEREATTAGRVAGRCWTNPRTSTGGGSRGGGRRLAAACCVALADGGRRTRARSACGRWLTDLDMVRLELEEIRLEPAADRDGEADADYARGVPGVRHRRGGACRPRRRRRGSRPGRSRVRPGASPWTTGLGLRFVPEGETSAAGSGCWQIARRRGPRPVAQLRSRRRRAAKDVAGPAELANWADAGRSGHPHA